MGCRLILDPRQINSFLCQRPHYQDRLVTHAIKQAYADVLYHGRSPVYCLFFSVNPVLVDVNVHPTKHEVRFRENRDVRDFIFRSIHRALADVDLIVKEE